MSLFYIRVQIVCDDYVEKADIILLSKLTILILSNMSDTIENVLILQGGGSLGAFGCGVFKALASSDIKIDIIAGTSVGGLMLP